MRAKHRRSKSWASGLFQDLTLVSLVAIGIITNEVLFVKDGERNPAIIAAALATLGIPGVRRAEEKRKQNGGD